MADGLTARPASAAAERAREQAARWFARLQNLADDELAERGRFERWLCASPLHAAAFREMAELWEGLDHGPLLTQLAAAAACDAPRPAQPPRRRLLRQSLGAVAAAGAGLVIWRAFNATEAEDTRAEWQTRPGEHRQQRLPDGSRVTLAGDTRLALRWSARQRRVHLLQGMAAFDVASDPERPFVVDGGQAQVTVLGTQFGVNRLPDRLRVSVTEGRVQVVPQQSLLSRLWRGEGPSWPLGAGDVLEVRDGRGQRLARRASDELAWQRGHLVLVDADLQEVAAALSRYSMRPVRAEPSDRLAQVRLAAVVQTDDIAGFLRALPGIAPLRVEPAADAIWLRAAGP